MLNENQTQDVLASTVYSNDDEKIGKVGQLFLDDVTGRPEFVTVNTGFFGTSESFVPVTDANFDGDRLKVPFDKDKVKNAPKIDLDGGHLDQDEEARLYDYYGHPYNADQGGEYTAPVAQADVDTTRSETDRPTVGHDTSGPTTDDAMTRSEERLRVGTTTEEAGRARLRKYVTTEQETVTVPVRKEHAVLVSEPITDANRGDALDGPAISDEEHEVILHEERPVVEKTVEAVERVRLDTETVVGEETVTEEVRKENIETDGDIAPR